MYIDERLSWLDHIKNISRKLTAGIAGLRQVRCFVPLQTSITIYNSLIQPLFNYCDIVCDNMPCTCAHRLQKLQNRAAKVITCQGYEVKSSEIRQYLNWKNLAETRAMHKLIMMYKVLNSMSPSYSRDHFKISTINDRYSLRNKKLSLVLPKASIEYLKKVLYILDVESGVICQII